MWSLRRQRNRRILGAILLSLLSAAVTGAIFFGIYFRVEHVEVRGSTRYSDEEIRKMVLTGPFAGNSVLAPKFYSKSNVKDITFVDSFSVTQMSRDTICINVMEKKPVGCIHYLDSYVYFDRNGVFIEGARERDEKIPYFSGVEVNSIIEDKKLPLRSDTVLNTAVTLSTIFQKNEMLPDSVVFDETSQIRLAYGDISVLLGKNQFLEDKMGRVIAILPQLEGMTGILHLESVSDNSKRVTFERDAEEYQASLWTGGYDSMGNYTGTGEYDASGEYVGPKPTSSALAHALAAWNGGYDGEGDYTGNGEYDKDGNRVCEKPTEESIAALGGWTGGYTQDGIFDGVSEYDFEGNYVGPMPPVTPSPEPDGDAQEGAPYEEEGTGGEASYYTEDGSGDYAGYGEDYSGYSGESGYSDYSGESGYDYDSGYDSYGNYDYDSYGNYDYDYDSYNNYDDNYDSYDNYDYDYGYDTDYSDEYSYT